MEQTQEQELMVIIREAWYTADRYEATLDVFPERAAQAILEAGYRRAEDTVPIFTVDSDFLEPAEGAGMTES